MIETTNPEVILKTPLTKLGKRKPQSPMIRIILTMTKAAAVPLAARTSIESTVAEMHISYINQQLIVNPSLLENKLSSNNLYEQLHDAYLLNTMKKPTN